MVLAWSLQSTLAFQRQRMDYLVNIITREWCVRGHQEMAPWCRDEGCDDADKVIVHISRIPQRLCTSGHDSGYLHTSSLVTRNYAATHGLTS